MHVMEKLKPEPSRLIDAKEAASRLGIKLDAFYRRLRDNVVEGVAGVNERGAYLFDPDELAISEHARPRGRPRVFSSDRKRQTYVRHTMAQELAWDVQAERDGAAEGLPPDKRGRAAWLARLADRACTNRPGMPKPRRASNQG